jgi:hypothetical protein
MTVKQTVISVFTAFVVGGACGFFAKPAKVVTKTETKVVTQLVKDTTQDQDKHSKIVVVVVRKPDGTQTTTTTKTQDSDTKTNTDETDHKAQDTQSSKEVTYSKSSLNISALLGVKLGTASAPAYGLGVTKQLFGPFTIGAFGLVNGTVGGSVGVTF